MPRLEDRWAPEYEGITPLEPLPRCGDPSNTFGATFFCERLRDHDGNHGAGPFIQYTMSWPQEKA